MGGEFVKKRYVEDKLNCFILSIFLATLCKTKYYCSRKNTQLCFTKSFLNVFDQCNKYTTNSIIGPDGFNNIDIYLKTDKLYSIAIDDFT